MFTFIENETTFSTESGRIVRVKLCDLPRVLQHDDDGTYELRNAINY